MIEINGAHGEGGGQLLRMALSLAALTRRATRVNHIRAGRPNPGLAPQHVAALGALTQLAQAKVEGAKVGSTAVTFRPGPLIGGHFELDVGTAGSVTLVLQAALLPALFAPSPTALRISGGTDVRWSPPADYTRHVFLPLLSRMESRVTLHVERRGYYPRGGGRIQAEITPTAHLRPLALGAPPDVSRIGGHAHVGNLPENVVGRMKRRTERVLDEFQPIAIDTSTYGPQEAVGRGGALVLWAERGDTFLGASALAEKGVKAETLAERAGRELRADLLAKVTLDRYAADQLLPFMALASGPSVFRVREASGHLKTLFWLLPHFLDVNFRIQEETAGTRVEVTPSRTWSSAETPPGA
ncbi:MAG: RNA 3'-terminal phosphate cyclase [Thermoplasmata archaeon]